jgi:O6-methylguanine-DNA--protein-cysteine methyltransferase
VAAIQFDDAETSFGKITLVWAGELEPRVVRLLLPAQVWALRTLFPHAARSRSDEVSHLFEEIAQFLGGEEIKLPLDLLDLDSCSRFQRKVILAEYEVPRGYVTTYGRIARHLGAPRSSRAVGQGPGNQPVPHRHPLPQGSQERRRTRWLSGRRRDEGEAPGDGGSPRCGKKGLDEQGFLLIMKSREVVERDPLAQAACDSEERAPQHHAFLVDAPRSAVGRCTPHPRAKAFTSRRR